MLWRLLFTQCTRWLPEPKPQLLPSPASTHYNLTNSMNIINHKTPCCPHCSIVLTQALRCFYLVFVLVVSAMPLAAQFGTNGQTQFGRSKTQYETFEWNTIQSRNFDIYYHQGGEYLAQYAAVVLEESLKPLQRTLNYAVNQRIPVILYNSYNQFQQTNSLSTLLPRGVGSTADISKNKIVVPFQGDWRLFRHTLRHELVHSFVNDLFFGGAVQSQLSSGFRVELPAWLSEGFAEYMVSSGFDTQTDMYIRDLVVNNRFPTPQTVTGKARDRVGQAFFSHVAAKFGAGKISELMGRLRAVGVLENAFRGSFGLGVEPFWKLWSQELQMMYRPDAAKFQDVDTFAMRLVDTALTDNGYNLSPTISPNGNKIAYLNMREGVLSVYVTDAATKKTERVFSTSSPFDEDEFNPLKQSLSWKSDGKQLALVSTAGGADALTILNTATGNKERFEFGFKTMSSVAWSPDGKAIAFTASENESPNLYLFDIATRKVRKLTDDVFTESEPVWSWDSKTIYFVSERGKYTKERATKSSFAMWEYDVNSSDIYAVNLSTRKIERLTSDAYNRKISLAVAPDNASLLFVSDKNGINNLYQLNLITGEVTPKTNSLNSISQLSLARDGSRLLFTAQKSGRMDIFSLPQPFSQLNDRSSGVSVGGNANTTDVLRQAAKDVEFTPYRKEIAEREEAAAKTAELLEQRDTVRQQQVPDTLRGYGKFDIDFSRQRMVFPDLDAATALSLVQQSLSEVDTAIVGKLPSKPYRFSLSNDYFLLNPAWDTFINFYITAQALFTDLLGNHRAFIGANFLPLSLFRLNFDQSDLYASYAYLGDVIDYEANAFRTARALYIYKSSVRNIVYSRLSYWGAGARAMLPLTPTSRVEGSLRWINTSDESIDDARIPTESKMMVVPELRFVFDNSGHANVFAPTTGGRGFLAIDGSPGLGSSAPTFARIMGDYRQYIPLSIPGVNNPLTIALRAAAGTCFGGDAQRFFAGGTENIVFNATYSDGYLPFKKAEDLVFLVPGFPLRGFDIGAKDGRNYFLANAEVRIPIIRNVSAGPVTGLLQSLQGTVFMDVGSAWTDTFVAGIPRIDIDVRGNPAPPVDGDILMSMGVGVRAILLGLPVKFDLAWLNAQGGWSSPRWTISLGADF